MLTAHNTVERVMTPERLDSHRLIEEFMILANVAAAETLERARVPLIYRVHDEPDPERVNALREFLQSVDISFPKGGALRAEAAGHDVSIHSFDQGRYARHLGADLGKLAEQATA